MNNIAANAVGHIVLLSISPVDHQLQFMLLMLQAMNQVIRIQQLVCSHSEHTHYLLLNLVVVCSRCKNSLNYYCTCFLCIGGEEGQKWI